MIMKTKDIQIPFGAQDSELKGWEYTIPEGMEAIIKDGKVIVREKESEDERIYNLICSSIKNEVLIASPRNKKLALAYLEKQKEQKEKELDVKDYRLRDTWEYIDEFIKKFGRIPKDIDELSVCVDYVIEHKFIDEKYQKTIEWSDEDKAMLKVAIAVLRRYSHDDVADWLKSLRHQPHWKPSEEQIDALNSLNVCGEFTYIGQQNELISLYNDLKKLGVKEEPDWKTSEKELEALEKAWFECD